MLGEEHDYFFMVAGANRNEVLFAFREAVDDAIANGKRWRAFASGLMRLSLAQAGITKAVEIGELVLFTTPMFMRLTIAGGCNNI